MTLDRPPSRRDHRRGHYYTCVHSDRFTISTRGLEGPNRFAILDPPPSSEPSYRTWERGWKYSTRRASKVLDLLNIVIYRMTRNTRGTSLLSYSRTPIDRSTLVRIRYLYDSCSCMACVQVPNESGTRVRYSICNLYTKF